MEEEKSEFFLAHLQDVDESSNPKIEEVKQPHHNEELDSIKFAEDFDERILLHDDLIEETSDMFESYQHHIKFPVDFKPLMFREFFSIGKNENIWTESSRSLHSPDIPLEEVGSGSITMKTIDDDQILILIIQRITINHMQQIMEVVTVIDQNLQLIRENIVERIISVESIVAVS